MDSEFAASEWCSGSGADADCDPLSACPLNTAAATAQHGNNAVLSQNTAHAMTNPTRANPRRRVGPLATGILAEFRILDGILVELHPDL